MRTAIIAMEYGDNPDENKANAEAALAIATAIAPHNMNPWLICNAGSLLASMPVPIPRFCLETGTLISSFKLWQWQRQEEKLLILCIGTPSLKLGRTLVKMGKKNQNQMWAAFFLAPPSREDTRYLIHASTLLCGSTFIATALAELTSSWKKKPEMIEVAPGIPTAAFTPATPWQDGTRFIFGMDGSLLEHSGALMVVRAMAALWQQEDLPKWEVRMFGSGPRYAEIMAEAEKLGVLPRLAILDAQPLPEVIQYCHVWLAPGTSETEMPWVLWAGFAAKIPVICTTSPLHQERLWIPDAIIPITSDNPQEMARAMLNTMRDKELRNQLVQAAEPLLPQISFAGMANRVYETLQPYTIS